MLIEQRNSLKGEITVPCDKSISHRAIMIAALANGITEIDGLSLSEDCLSTIECFRKMQVAIEILPNKKVKVHGNGLFGLKPPLTSLNTSKSGTTLRLLLGVLSGQQFSSVLVRDEVAQKKQVGRIVRPLRNMGANISGRDDGNLCPLTISPSKLKSATHNLSVMDILAKSPIIMAALYAEGQTDILEAVKSRDHTELMLNNFGANIKIEGTRILINPVEELYAQHIAVPGDMSIASYFITAGILTKDSDITIKNLGINPTRSGLIDIYKQMGANIELYNEHTENNEKVADVRVTSSELKGIDIEGETVARLLDEVPIIAVSAALAKGTTTIRDLNGFRIKDSGKLKLLAGELSKMGAKIQETFDGLVIEGRESLKGTVIESFNEQDIVMAMSIAGLVASGETMIRKAQILDIAFPEFVTVLNSL